MLGLHFSRACSLQSHGRQIYDRSSASQQRRQVQVPSCNLFAHNKTNLPRCWAVRNSTDLHRMSFLKAGPASCTKMMEFIGRNPIWQLTCFTDIISGNYTLIQRKSKEESSEDWVAQNQDLVRASPLVAGGLGIFSVILNRSVAGVGP